MIRMIRQHAMCTIELLGEYDPHECVRKSEPGERPAEIASCQHLRGKPVRASYQERHVPPLLHASAEPGSQFPSRHLGAAFVQDDHEVVLAHCSQETLTLGPHRTL